MIKRSNIICLALALAAIMLAGCGSESKATATGSQGERVANAAFADSQIEPFRAELIKTAFDIAAKIPLEPHIKTRARAQQQAAELALKLDLPATALEYTKQIPNWRRGSSYADLAMYCTKNGMADRIPGFLEKAIEVAASDLEDWRRDTIRVKVAQVHAMQNRVQQADKMQAGVVDSQLGKVTQINALNCDAMGFDKLIVRLDAEVATGTYGLIVNALVSYTTLYDRFYEDATRRDLIENKIKLAWDTIPYTKRIETLTRLAESAIDRKDFAKASQLADEIDDFIFSVKWPTRYIIPLIADFAKLQSKAKNTARATELADMACQQFKDNGEEIINIYRTRALCPLAEAYFVLGSREKALEVYKLAATQAVVNPNSRPRAEDLAVICRSMASFGVEPDAELWTRIRKISEDLGQPW